MPYRVEISFRIGGKQFQGLVYRQQEYVLGKAQIHKYGIDSSSNATGDLFTEKEVTKIKKFFRLHMPSAETRIIRLN